MYSILAHNAACAPCVSAVARAGAAQPLPLCAGETVPRAAALLHVALEQPNRGGRERSLPPVHAGARAQRSSARSAAAAVPPSRSPRAVHCHCRGASRAAWRLALLVAAAAALLRKGRSRCIADSWVSAPRLCSGSHARATLASAHTSTGTSSCVGAPRWVSARETAQTHRSPTMHCTESTCVPAPQRQNHADGAGPLLHWPNPVDPRGTHRTRARLCHRPSPVKEHDKP